jgi:hypothetical protein
MENKKTLEQVQQLKLNVTNIHSFLVKENKRKKKLASIKEKEEKKKLSIKKSKEEEKKLEEKKKSKQNKNKKKEEDSSKKGNIFDKILEFGSLVLSGILVNALPKIIEEVKKIVDAIVNFVTPIQSGFNLIKAFFEGDIDKSEYDADKKRVDGELEKISGKGGLIDQLAEKAGPLGELIKTLKPAIELIRNVVGGKKMVLAKKGGKEGVLNKETGEFTERQFTSAEREQYESQDKKPTSSQDKKPTSSQDKKPTSSPDNKPIGSQISTPVGPITPGGTLDFIGSGDGASGTLVLKDRKGKKLGSWEAISGVFRTANASQEDRRNVSGTLNPLPDGTYPLMGFAKHGYIGGVGTWSTYINNMAGSIGSRSQLLVHNDIGSNGTAGCVGVELGGRSGTDAENKFLKLYEAAKPTSIRVAIGKGANKSTAPPRSTDNTPVTTARINSVDKKSQQMDSINQKDPRKRRGSMTVAVQQVNTIQSVPYMMPMPVASKSFASSQPTELSSIWSV